MEPLFRPHICFLFNQKTEEYVHRLLILYISQICPTSASVVLNRSDPIILFTIFSCEEIMNEDSGCNNENEVHSQIIFYLLTRVPLFFGGIFCAPLTKKGLEPLVYMLKQSNLFTTTPIGTQKQYPQLTVGRCSEVIYVIKVTIRTSE